MTELICPACDQPGMQVTVRRESLPVMQNYVYRYIDLAYQAGQGRFDLAVCLTCGFAHNAVFDPTLVRYDEGYDNSVPSEVMSAYYRDLASYLHAHYALDDALVVDVGCGKGTFLKIMVEAFPKVRGLGIDPSYQGAAVTGDGRLEFIKDFFSAQHVRERPALVICRHVIEHIPRPSSFLRAIRMALAGFPGTPCFFEVPDVRWIVDNGAFWDFCYEHCNYMTPQSFANVLAREGFQFRATRPAFGDQYIWTETTSTGDLAMLPAGPGQDLGNRLLRYERDEQARMSDIAAKLMALKLRGCRIVLWGMATKGVIFSLLVDARRAIIDHCVDVNTNKQGCYVPLTGHLIEAPSVLAMGGSRPVTVVVMNSNYAAEIKRACVELKVDAEFIDANGDPV